MSRGSDVPPLREHADRYLASRPGHKAIALLPLAHGEGDPTKGLHVRTARPADPAAASRNSILRVEFTRGEVQLAARGADLTLDITAKHFDVAGYPRREHAYGRLTRVEAQRLIAALLVLASTPDNPADSGSEVPQRAARHSVGLRPARIKPITARTVQG
jgi:hypothetical protein